MQQPQNNLKNLNGLCQVAIILSEPSSKFVLRTTRHVYVSEIPIKKLRDINFHIYPYSKDVLSCHTENESSLQCNEHIYKKTMRAITLGQIPSIVGNSSAGAFSGVEAVSKKFATLNVLHINSSAQMLSPSAESAWHSSSFVYNIINQIPNVTRVVQVGIKNLQKKELENLQRTNNKATSQGINFNLGSLGKAFPKTWMHTQQNLSRARFQGKTWNKVTNNIVKALLDPTWISIDISCLEGFGTQKTLGMKFDELLHLVENVVLSGIQIIGFDISYIEDSADSRYVGEDLFYKLSNYAAISQNIL